jgi:mannitol-1-/sugar-/sorbitol-6-phosphatase
VHWSCSTSLPNSATEIDRNPISSLAGRTFGALLFDMDGTLLSSIRAAERVWTAWAERHGLDVQSFLPTIHGVKTIETIRRLALPGVDPQVEADAITRAEIEDVAGIEQIAGAAAFLKALPEDRWAIVTSASKALALRRIESAQVPLPKILVTAEDVPQGKPAPDCFLLAARRLGVAAKDCLVFEDALPGIAAAEAAGASVVVITATHTHRVETPHACVHDYSKIAMRTNAAGRLSVMSST